MQGYLNFCLNVVSLNTWDGLAGGVNEMIACSRVASVLVILKCQALEMCKMWHILFISSSWHIKLSSNL